MVALWHWPKTNDLLVPGEQSHGHSHTSSHRALDAPTAHGMGLQLEADHDQFRLTGMVS